MRIRYTHQAITTEQQINTLKERGLIVDDIEQAISTLDNISYFRLAGYWRNFEIDRTTHHFKDGCRFVDVIELYSFDKQLRVLLFTAIQTIEVTVRTKIIKHFAPEFGAFWFMDERHATNEMRFAANLAVVRKEVERSRRFYHRTFPQIQRTRPASCLENIGGHLNGDLIQTLF